MLAAQLQSLAPRCKPTLLQNKCPSPRIGPYRGGWFVPLCARSKHRPSLKFLNFGSTCIRMARPEFPPLSLRVLMTVLIASLPSLCSSMAAWYANAGVQFLMQDEDDYLYYSYCNTNFDVVFPKDKPLKLPVSAKPQSNTSLAGVGWYDEEGQTTWVCSVLVQCSVS